MIDLAAIGAEVLAPEPLFGLPLAEGWFVLVFAILGAFLLLDGFDFGAGVLFALRNDEHDRESLLAAIGPFWDGNEVWLVVFGGALFAAFPEAYATLFSRYYLLMFAILGALIARGLAPEMYEQRDDRTWKRAWGLAFVVGSLAAPFLLGAFVGNWWTGAASSVSLPGVLVGLALVALTVVDGAAFLGTKVEGDLRKSLPRYGRAGLAAYLSLVVVLLVFLGLRPGWGDALLEPLPLAFVGLTLLAGSGYAVAIGRDRFRLAFAAVAAMVYSLVGLVAATMYPAVDPASGLSVAEAIVSPVSLNLMTVGAAILLPLVLAYFATLYSAFSGPIEAGETY